MYLAELLGCGLEDAMIAEVLSRPSTQVILEIQAKIATFGYAKAKSDPKPEILVFGRWEHPNTGNRLLCGINLNYVDDKKSLEAAMPQIMAKDSTKARYWEAMALLPDIMKSAYRTYDERFVHPISDKNIEVGEPGAAPPDQTKVEPLAKPPQERPIEPDLEKPGSGTPEKIPDVPMSAQPTPTKPVPVPVKPSTPPKPLEVPPVAARPEETPKRPTETPSKGTVGAAKAEVPPKKAKGLIAKAKAVFGKLADLVRNKLSRNRGKTKDKSSTKDEPKLTKQDKEKEVQRINKLANDEETLRRLKEKPPVADTPEKQVYDLNRLEQDAKNGIITPTTPDEEVEELRDLERRNKDDSDDKGVGEDFDERLDVILERYACQTRSPVWSSPQEYIETHSLDRFFDYHHKVGDLVLESAGGCHLMAIYNIDEDCMIFDLADSHEEMLVEAGWDWANTIRLTATNNGVEIAYDDPRGQFIADTIINSDIGHFLDDVSRV